MTEAEAERMVYLRYGLRDAASYMKAASARDIVTRMLRNLLSADGDATPGESLKYLDLIVRLRPDSVQDRLARARARWMAGDLEGARADIEEALELSPELRDDPLFREWNRER